MEIKAAIAQTRSARRHSIPVESAGALRGAGIVGGSKGKTGGSWNETLDETFPATGAATGSGMATRIWGAPHCRQKGLPSSTLWPHL